MAWGVERVFSHTGDKVLLEQSLDRIEKFHEWWWRERDLYNNGLITVGTYTAVLQHAR